MKTIKKCVSLALSLALLVSLCAGFSVPALAASDIALTYDLSVGGEHVVSVENPGDTVAVTFAMRRTDAAESYSLFSMQNEIEYDMSFFEFVSAAAVHSANYNGITTRPTILHQTRTTGQSIVKTTIMTANDVYQANETICTVTLRVRTDAGLQTGDSGWVRSSEAKANERDVDACAVTAQDLTVFLGAIPTTSYQVSFDANGGAWSTAADDPSGTYAANASITLPTPVREGYAFDGWYVGTTAVDGTAYTVTADATLTARWRGSYTVTYVLAGGSDLSGGNAVGANEGDTITLPKPVRVGYVFNGWSDGTATYAAGASYTVNSNATLTATWTACAHPETSRQVTGSRTAYLHSGLSVHDVQVSTDYRCGDCGAVLDSVTATTASGVACTGTHIGGNWLSNATQHWHHCDVENADVDIADHVYDNDTDTTCNVCGYTRTVETGGGTGGAGGGGGGTGGGGGAGGGSIVNPGGGTTTIVDNEVPLADVDSIIVTSLVDPTTGASVSGERDENGHVVVTVKDASGNVLDTVPGGVRVSFTIREGEVAILLDKDGNEIELLEKSVVEGQTAYVLVGGSCIVDIKYNALPFDDVMPYDWFNSAVVFASSHELFNGVAEGVFAPNTPMTRGMLVTVLWRLENKPEDFAANLFPDVADNTWYTEAVEWATKHKIVEGYDDGTFMPNRNISRQEMAAILYRYMNYLGYDMSAQGDLSAFADSESVSAWALPSVRWANGAGIITGKDGNRIDPLGNATRAEVATMFMRIVTEMVM